MGRLRSRVGTSVDIGKLSQALARPGIDTRTWLSLAYALGESVVDKEHGVFVDVMLAPTGERMTARVATEYAGAGFGFYGGAVHKDDELLVGVPLGDPAEGAVVLRRLWSAADKPPQQAIDAPSEVVLVVEKDKTHRTVTSGSGKTLHESEASVTLKTGKVLLGDEDATEQVPLGTTWRSKEVELHNQLVTQLGTLSTLLTTAGASLSAAGPLVLLPPAGASISAAGAALTSAVTAVTNMASAITAYETAASTAQNFLSEVSKTK